MDLKIYKTIIVIFFSVNTIYFANASENSKKLSEICTIVDNSELSNGITSYYEFTNSNKRKPTIEELSDLGVIEESNNLISVKIIRNAKASNCSNQRKANDTKSFCEEGGLFTFKKKLDPSSGKFECSFVKLKTKRAYYVNEIETNEYITYWSQSFCENPLIKNKTPSDYKYYLNSLKSNQLGKQVEIDLNSIADRNYFSKNPREYSFLLGNCINFRKGEIESSTSKSNSTNN